MHAVFEQVVHCSCLITIKDLLNFPRRIQLPKAMIIVLVNNVVTYYSDRNKLLDA